MTLKFNSVLEVLEVHVQNFIKLSAAVHEYQQRTWFRTTLDFDRKYLRNETSNRQAENGVSNYDSFHVQWIQFGELWSTNEKNDLDLWPWNSI